MKKLPLLVTATTFATNMLLTACNSEVKKVEPVQDTFKYDILKMIDTSSVGRTMSMIRELEAYGDKHPEEIGAMKKYTDQQNGQTYWMMIVNANNPNAPKP